MPRRACCSWMSSDRSMTRKCDSARRRGFCCRWRRRATIQPCERAMCPSDVRLVSEGSRGGWCRQVQAVRVGCFPTQTHCRSLPSCVSSVVWMLHGISLSPVWPNDEFPTALMAGMRSPRDRSNFVGVFTLDGLLMPNLLDLLFPHPNHEPSSAHTQREALVSGSATQAICPRTCLGECVEQAARELDDVLAFRECDLLGSALMVVVAKAKASISSISPGEELAVR